MLLLEIFFWTAFLLIAHSYLLYPIFTQLLGRFFNNNSSFYSLEEELPLVSVLMAAHNEEQVIEEKIGSILNSNYPSSKIEILIGSDRSTDKTNAIIKSMLILINDFIFSNSITEQGKLISLTI